MQPLPGVTAACYRHAVRLTFAIPFYSGRALLERTIASVLAQHRDDWTAFVCDNASAEPGIEELVRTVGQGRVGYVRNVTNLGMAGNFNRCIDLAETDLVTLVHSDDELEPTYASTILPAAERHPSAAAVYCRVTIIDDDSRPFFSLADVVKDFVNPGSKGETELAGEAGMRALIRGNFILAPTLCFRKSVLGARRFDGSTKFVLDWDLTTKLLLDGDVLVAVPERCYRYRKHAGSTSNELTRNSARYREESEFYDRMATVTRARGWTRCAEIAEAKRLLKLNLIHGALKSVATLQLRDARRGYEILRQL
jgi:glycosyltransferase involved in cell wall biosynthesis